MEQGLGKINGTFRIMAQNGEGKPSALEPLVDGPFQGPKGLLQQAMEVTSAASASIDAQHSTRIISLRYER